MHSIPSNNPPSDEQSFSHSVLRILPEGMITKRFCAAGETLRTLDRCAKAFELTREEFLEAMLEKRLPNQFPPGAEARDIGAIGVSLSRDGARLAHAIAPFFGESVESMLRHAVQSLFDSAFDDLIFHPVTREPLCERDLFDDGEDSLFGEGEDWNNDDE